MNGVEEAAPRQSRIPHGGADARAYRGASLLPGRARCHDVNAPTDPPFAANASHAPADALREAARLAALRECAVLDTPPERVFDDLTLIASAICDAPVALVSLVDEGRQWFKSARGIGEVRETPREVAFCAHAIVDRSELFVVRDARADRRFAANPLVQGGPMIRFYAGAPLRTADGHALGTLCVLDREPRDLTPAQADALLALARQAVMQLELRRAARLAAERSLTDALTGLPNRRAFDERFAQEWNRQGRNGRSLALLLIDVDHFKRFNDGFGHVEGNRLLCDLAAAMLPVLRSADLLARWGGDEFAVILPDTDVFGATRVAGRLRAAVARARLPHARTTVTIGAASEAPSPLRFPEQLLRQVDDALHHAKAMGRDCVFGRPREAAEPRAPHDPMAWPTLHNA